MALWEDTRDRLAERNGLEMIEVQIDGGTDSSTVLRAPTRNDIPDLVNDRWNNRSTTLTVFDTTAEERQLIIGLSQGRAFVGLVAGDRQFQLTQGSSIEQIEMTIGGQTTMVAERFTVGSAQAIQAIESFVDGAPLNEPTLVWTPN
jgi:hypothetical protein